MAEWERAAEPLTCLGTMFPLEEMPASHAPKIEKQLKSCVSDPRMRQQSVPTHRMAPADLPALCLPWEVCSPRTPDFTVPSSLGFCGFLSGSLCPTLCCDCLKPLSSLYSPFAPDLRGI